MPKLDEALGKELIELVRQFKEESAPQYRAVVARATQLRMLISGNSAPGDWWDEGQLRWRPAKESPIYTEDTAPRFKNDINYSQAWWLIHQGAIQTVGIPGATFRPQNGNQESDREAARTGKQIIEYEETVTDFRDLMLGIWRFFSTDGICLAYTRHIKDPLKYGTTTIQEPIKEQGITQPAGYACPGCGGFSASGTTARDQTGAIGCPECSQPLHAENFIPEETGEVVVGQKPTVKPNGRENTELFGVLEGLLPWWAQDLGQAQYCDIEVEVPKEEIVGTFAADDPELEAKIWALDSGDLKIEGRARQRAKAPGGETHSVTENHFTTYSRWWFRPKCFYRIQDQEKRKELLRLYPSGCFFQLAGSADPVLLDAIEEKMESKLTLMRPMKGDGMYTPALLQSGVPIHLSMNDAYNLALEGMLFAAFGQGYANEELFSGAGINATRLSAGNIKLLHVPPQVKMSDGFFEMKSQDVSQSVQNFLEMGPRLGEFLLGTPPALRGEAITNVRTLGGQSQARSQALQRLAPAYGALKIGFAGILEKMVNEFLQNRFPETFYEVTGDSGDYETVKIQLNPERGRVVAFPEASESIPQTWAQKADFYMGLLDSQNPVVQTWLEYPENTRTYFDTIGGGELVVPGKELLEKYERLIDILLEGAPQEVEVPNELDPTAPPVTITVPSIPFKESLDDAKIALTVLRKWAATRKGMEITASGSDGARNIEAYAEQAYMEIKAMAAAQAPQT